MATRQASDFRVIDMETRARRQRRQLEKLEAENFVEDPFSGEKLQYRSAFAATSGSADGVKEVVEGAGKTMIDMTTYNQSTGGWRGWKRRGIGFHRCFEPRRCRCQREAAETACC